MPHVEIRVQGRIAEHWSSWFEGLEVDYTDDQTTLSGYVVDHAALYGLLSRLHDRGLSLLSVETSQVERDSSP